MDVLRDIPIWIFTFVFAFNLASVQVEETYQTQFQRRSFLPVCVRHCPMCTHRPLLAKTFFGLHFIKAPYLQIPYGNHSVWPSVRLPVSLSTFPLRVKSFVHHSLGCTLHYRLKVHCMSLWPAFWYLAYIKKGGKENFSSANIMFCLT